MTTINISAPMLDDRRILDLNDASMKRWGTVAEMRVAPVAPESAEHQAAETIVAAYRAFAIDRLMEIVRLRVRRNAMPRWRWLADLMLQRRQDKALAHARRHLANISTAEQVQALIP
jgi:hypothetical protein